MITIMNALLSKAKLCGVCMGAYHHCWPHVFLFNESTVSRRTGKIIASSCSISHDLVKKKGGKLTSANQLEINMIK